MRESYEARETTETSPEDSGEFGKKETLADRQRENYAKYRDGLGDDPTDLDTYDNELLSSEKGYVSEARKADLKNSASSPEGKSFSMDTDGTIEAKKDYLTKADTTGKSLEKFEDALSSGADKPKISLIGKGTELYVTGDNASGNYSTREHPGDSSLERKNNLQLPPENDGKTVKLAKTTEAFVGITSQVKAQPEWAEKGNYTAQDGIQQIYIPSTSAKSAFETGKLQVLDEFRDGDEDEKQKG